MPIGSVFLASAALALAPAAGDSITPPQASIVSATAGSTSLHLRSTWLDAASAPSPWTAALAQPALTPRGLPRDEHGARRLGLGVTASAWPAQRGAQSAGASGGTDANASASTAPSAGDTAAATPASDASAAQPEEPEPDIELIRHRERLTRIHRTLGITTWASLAVTTTLGTLVAMNQPTLFGRGFCSSADGRDVLGDFGCGPLSAVHEISALISVGLYATTGIFALSMPDPEHASAGNDARGTRLRLHRAMAWVHLVGMVLEPLLGVISVVPGAIGVPSTAQADFSSAMRTVHLGVGYVTFAALTTAMILEL